MTVSGSAVGEMALCAWERTELHMPIRCGGRNREALSSGRRPLLLGPEGPLGAWQRTGERQMGTEAREGR